MPLLASDVLLTARNFMDEPSNSERYSDQLMLDFLNEEQKQLALSTNLPIATAEAATTGVSSGKYALPELNNIMRAYIAIGTKPNYTAIQPLITTSIDELEGTQIGLYDQSGANYTPQWRVAPVTAYPVSSLSSMLTPSTVPYWPGQRPRIARFGGYIVIVPPPASGATILLEIAALPTLCTPLTNPPSTFTLDFPINCKEALAWGVAYRCYASDGPNETGMQVALSAYTAQTKLLVGWVENMFSRKPGGVIPRTRRSAYRGVSETMIRGSTGWGP